MFGLVGQDTVVVLPSNQSERSEQRFLPTTLPCRAFTQWEREKEMARATHSKANGLVLDRPVVLPTVPEPTELPVVPEVEVQPAHNGVEMTAGANMAEAGRGILYHQLSKLRKAEPVAREGSDPEGVHDMRVATRRLRAALQVLGETVYDSKLTGRYRKDLRKLANALGETRDSDVFLEHLNQYIAQLPEADQAGMEPLRQEIESRRTAGRKAMLKLLDNTKTEKLLQKLEHFVNKEGAGLAGKSVDEAEAAPSLVRHFAGSAIWRRYEEVLAYETVMGPQTSVVVLHRLRVACKRLRYTVEFFQDALPTGVKQVHQQLVEAQDELGVLHDHQVAIELSEKLLEDNPGDTVLQTYHDKRQAEMEQIRAQFPAQWQNLISATYRRQLATILAGSNPGSNSKSASKAQEN